MRWSGERPEGACLEGNQQGIFVRIAGTTDRLFEFHAISNDDSPPNPVGCIRFCWINMLMAECDSGWSTAKIPTKYFNRINKARRQLAHVNVQIDEQAMMLKALKCFKDTGNYDAPIREWEARPAAA